MDDTAISTLPDELLEAITFYLPPDATLSFGTACKRINKIAYEHLVWRRHCIQTWRYWESTHELQERLQQPPAQTKWRHLYNERRRTDKLAMETFEELLKTQQNGVIRKEVGLHTGEKDRYKELVIKYKECVSVSLLCRTHADSL